MIALRNYPRPVWEKTLRNLGCRLLEGKGPLNTAEWWITDWDFLFTVPVTEGWCDQLSLERLIETIENARPDT